MIRRDLLKWLFLPILGCKQDKDMLQFFSSLQSAQTNIKLWALSDVHQGVNVGNLVQAVTDFNDFDYDVALNIGDDMGPDNGNSDDTGFEPFIDEFAGLSNGHTINDIYHIMGNSDATVKSAPEGKDFFFKKWCDPFGINTASSGVTQRPYPITGTYDAYSFEIGNMIIIMISDSNWDDPPAGENGQDREDPDGRRAGGALTAEQWNFLKDTVAANQNKIIIVCTHQAIKDTTIGSGWGEFIDGHHVGRVPSRSESRDPDTEQYQFQKGYIGFIENNQGSINTSTGDSTITDEIKTWLQSNGQFIDLWITGHYHTHIGETYAGRTRYEQVYNTNFLNIASVNHTLGWFDYPSGGTSPQNAQNVQSKSNLISIDGNNLNVKTYIHDDPTTAAIPAGFYAPEEINITLKRSFKK